MGIMMILAILWVVTGDNVSALLHKIDLSTILFFLGILTTVSALSETGILKSAGAYLDNLSAGNQIKDPPGKNTARGVFADEFFCKCTNCHGQF